MNKEKNQFLHFNKQNNLKKKQLNSVCRGSVQAETEPGNSDGTVGRFELKQTQTAY